MMALPGMSLPRSEIKEQIRALYLSMGIAPYMNDVIEKVIDSILPEEWKTKLLRRAVDELVRESLKRDAYGRLFCKPLSGGANPRWQQLDLFNLKEAMGLLDREYEQIKSDIGAFRELFERFRDRFGKGISIVRYPLAKDEAE